MGGRAPHVPNAETRKLVDAMIGCGVTEEDVARVLGVTDKTLRKHYKEEIKTAAIRANTKVAGNLFRIATNTKVSQPTVTAAIFWLKTKARWKETTVHEHTGPDGKPVTVSSVDPVEAAKQYQTLMEGKGGGK